MRDHASASADTLGALGHLQPRLLAILQCNSVTTRRRRRRPAARPRRGGCARARPRGLTRTGTSGTTPPAGRRRWPTWTCRRRRLRGCSGERAPGAGAGEREGAGAGSERRWPRRVIRSVGHWRIGTRSPRAAPAAEPAFAALRCARWRPRAGCWRK
jgi:hypothetical protein